jgi:hypothetical protein
MANVATEAEANLIFQKAEEYRKIVEEWIRKNYTVYAV